MNKAELRKIWENEENVAHIHGWDFSHIHGRYEEEMDLPWDYRGLIEKYINKNMNILDYDTGGGEFLLSLEHPYDKTSATEGYGPNVELCKEILLPLGIDFKACDNPANIPFPHLNLKEQKKAFVDAGFQILEADETYRPIKFYDVGAFVWFARIIEWEFPGFSVDKCFEHLIKMQKQIEEKGSVEGTIHRYMIIAKK